MRAEPHRLGGAFGLVAVALHAVAIACLWNVEGAYQPQALERWYYAALEHRAATSWGAWCMLLGAVSLVPWATGLARAIGPLAWPGVGLTAVAALLRCSAALCPIVVVTHLREGEVAIGQALLAVALTADAAAGLVWGSGLVLTSLAMARALNFRMWLSGWGLLGGALAVAVVGEGWIAPGADLAPIATPVWLAWLAVASLALRRVPFLRPTSADDAVDRPRRRDQLPFVPRREAAAAK